MSKEKDILVSKLQKTSRLISAYVNFTNHNQTLITLAISLFFLFTFALAATIFRYPFPTDDYLFWVFQNSHNWPATLFIPYNQHILILPKLLVHLDVEMLHGNTAAAVILAVFLVISILLLLMRQIVHVVRRYDSRLIVLAALCVSMLRGVELSVVSYPSNINHVFVIFFVAGLSVIFAGWARQRPITTLIAIILLSFCTVGSAANGLAALPVFLLFFHYHFRWRAGSTVYGLFALFLIVAYLMDLRSAHAVSTVAIHLPSPWTILLFMLNFAGAPWKIGAVNFSNGTYVGGILTLVVGVHTGWRFFHNRIEPWSLEGFALALLLFTSATGFLVAIGRGDMGMVQARSGRFFTGTETMQCATMTLLLLWLVEIRREALIQRFAMPVLVAAALLMLPSQIKAISASIQIHRRLEVTGRKIVAQTQSDPNRKDLNQSSTSKLGNLSFLVTHHLYGL